MNEQAYKRGGYAILSGFNLADLGCGACVAGLGEVEEITISTLGEWTGAVSTNRPPGVKGAPTRTVLLGGRLVTYTAGSPPALPRLPVTSATAEAIRGHAAAAELSPRVTNLSGFGSYEGQLRAQTIGRYASRVPVPPPQAIPSVLGIPRQFRSGFSGLGEDPMLDQPQVAAEVAKAASASAKANKQKAKVLTEQAKKTGSKAAADEAVIATGKAARAQNLYQFVTEFLSKKKKEATARKNGSPQAAAAARAQANAVAVVAREYASAPIVVPLPDLPELPWEISPNAANLTYMSGLGAFPGISLPGVVAQSQKMVEQAAAAVTAPGAGTPSAEDAIAMIERKTAEAKAAAETWAQKKADEMKREADAQVNQTLPQLPGATPPSPEYTAPGRTGIVAEDTSYTPPAPPPESKIAQALKSPATKIGLAVGGAAIAGLILVYALKRK